MARILLTTLAAGLVSLTAAADTVILKNGVKIDGKVLSQSETEVKIQIGNIDRAFPMDRVAGVEENEKTGVFNPEAALEASRKRLADLEFKTGLTAKQRQTVERYLNAMKSDNEDAYASAKKALLDFHRTTAPLDKYLTYSIPTLEPSFIAGVLDVYSAIDTFKAARTARTHITCLVPSGRAMALAVFAMGEAPDRAEVVARGMIDHEYDVRISAARTLGRLKAEEATPLLVDALGSGNPRLVAVAGNALATIWKSEPLADELQSQEEWQDFWNRKESAVAAPIVKVALLPLSSPDQFYVAEE